MGLGAKKPRAPEWQGREYSAWDKIDTWRQEEGRIYKARRQKLSADVAVRQQVENCALPPLRTATHVRARLLWRLGFDLGSPKQRLGGLEASGVPGR